MGRNMLLVACGLLSLLVGLVNSANPSFTLNFNQQTAAYTIAVNNKVWFSSTQYKLHINNNWYTTQDGSLKISQVTKSTGSDVLGEYTAISTSWLTSGSSSVSYITSARTYASLPNAIIFSQEFPNGASGTSLGSQDQPLTTFPNIFVNGSLGYLHYYSGDSFQSGVFPNNYKSGYLGGPIAFYDTSLNTVVASSLSYFLSVVTNIDTTDGNALYTGLQGKLQSIPANFKFDFIFYAGQGVQKTFMGWGDVLLARYHKTRVIPSATTVLAYLGYTTTGFYFYSPIYGNSSYLFYRNLPNGRQNGLQKSNDRHSMTTRYGNYEQTLLDFNAYSQKLGIPYKYYLIDSWWYGEYTLYNDGVWKWEDSDFLKYRFPHGLEWLHKQLGVPFAAHIGKWSATTPYAQNPDYGFIVEKQWAIPTNIGVYDFIFQNASQWGLNTLKQDHINEQILDMTATLADVNTARDWLLLEGKGAAHHGINIEYCMDWTTVVLTSLENPTATHSRAGGDYVPKQADSQWTIGVTSMFLWSIGLFPDKDTFYSTTTEVNTDPSSTFYNFKEPYPLLHAIASAMSAGPITPSDGVGGTDKNLVMAVCAADGLLLKPDIPAVSIPNFSNNKNRSCFVEDIDSTWIQRAFGTAGPSGDVITTYTQIGQYSWNFVFSANLKNPYNFLVSDLLVPFTQGLSVQYNTTTLGFSSSTPVPFASGKTITIPKGDMSKPGLWVIAPVLDNGWYYIGEVNKYIAVSKQRTVDVQTTPTTVSVELSGLAGEVVTLGFVAPTTLTKINTYTCQIGPSGRSIFTAPNNLCVPS